LRRGGTGRPSAHNGRVASGFSQADAQGDFSRARRARLLADIGRRLRREPDDVGLILPFEEVVEALGVTGREDHGLQVVPLDAIVGTVDRAADFDRGFRPTSPRLRSRWERIAAAQRRGESLPPISLYQVGDLYFVRDGHHRVSVAKSLGRHDIDAYVVEVTTRVRLGRDVRVGDLPLKDHERLFRERVPLGREERARISVTDPWSFTNEYLPVVEMLNAGELIERDETETDAYMRISGMRYRVLRTHEWSDEVLEELRRQEDRARRRRRRPPPDRTRRRKI
jgi:hypothetical protein